MSLFSKTRTIYLPPDSGATIQKGNAMSNEPERGALLPCPFCGGRASIKGDWNMAALSCDDRTGDCPGVWVSLPCHNPQRRAVSAAAWNTRAALPSAPHALYKNGDADATSEIKDRNGGVVLSQCRRCGRAEAELNESCVPAVPQALLEAEFERGRLLGMGQERALFELTKLGQEIEAQGAAPVVPQGWRLVPVEPTQEMLAPFDSFMRTEGARELLKLVFAAAPQHPSQPVSSEPVASVFSVDKKRGRITLVWNPGRPYLPVGTELYAAPREPAERVLNQCDGCQRGLPVANRLHRDATGPFACTASRYQAAERVPLTEQRIIDLAADNELLEESFDDEVIAYTRLVEAAHGIVSVRNELKGQP